MEFSNKPNTRSILDSGSSEFNSINNNLDNSTSTFQYVIKILRYILIIYLLTYVILTILNQFDLLPSWIKNRFTKIDIVHQIIDKKEKDNENQKEKQKENKKIDSGEQLATSMKKPKKPRPETIAPSQFTPENDNSIPEPDKSLSSTQSSKIANKAGYCYIGEDRGFRSCIKIKSGDECMSGNIFSTEAICINPNLRT